MSGVINPYDGSILFERVLKANLPTKTSGKKIFFVVNQPTDTVGEIWATNNEGTVVCYSVAVDVQTLNAAMEAFQKQLANLTETDTSLLNKINDLLGNTIKLGFGNETPRTTVTNANDLPQGVALAQNLINAPMSGWLYYETRRNMPADTGGYQYAYSDVQKRIWIRFFNSGKWDEIWTPVSPAKYLTLDEVGLSDTDFSPIDLGGNIAKILNNMKQGLDFEMYVGLHFSNLSNSFKVNSPSGVAEGSLRINKRANTAIPNKVEYMPNSNGTKNTLEIGFYDNSWSGLRKASNEITYINSGTHTLSDYMQEGTYCFGSGCTVTDIPVGVNGWLIVLPSNRTIPSTDIKQIWMRWGTPTTNSWMTYERLINPSTTGDWKYIGPPIKTEIPFPFNVGFENENASATSAQTSSLIKVGNEVEIIGNIRKTDQTPFAKGDIAMTLPSGYRPLKNLRISATCYPYGTNASLLIDKASGKVIVQAVSSATISVLSFIVKFNV